LKSKDSTFKQNLWQKWKIQRTIKIVYKSQWQFSFCEILNVVFVKLDDPLWFCQTRQIKTN